MKKVVLLFSLYFYSWKINDVVYVFKDAAGLWEYDAWRPLIASISNLIINIALINYIGLYGVVLSTILCELTFTLIWGCRVLFLHYFCFPFPKITFLLPHASDTIFETMR